MARESSPWRERDIHVATVVAGAWDRADWTYDIAVERTGIGRKRLQSIRAQTQTAISVGEAWAMCVALGLDALDVINGGDGVVARGEGASRVARLAAVRERKEREARELREAEVDRQLRERDRSKIPADTNDYAETETDYTPRWARPDDE